MSTEDIIQKHIPDWINWHEQCRKQVIKVMEEQNKLLIENIEQKLLDRWGFTTDGAINCKEQLKIFSLIGWLKNKLNTGKKCIHPYSHRRYKIEIDYCSYCKTILNTNNSYYDK